MKAMIPLRQENQRRIYLEAKKQVDDIFQRRCLDLDTVVMWILHRRFGFGKDRCRRFYDEYKPTTGKFSEMYGDAKYAVMREDLLRDGIDIETWVNGR